MAQSANTLSTSEKKLGWKLLFDGTSFDGWQELASNGWEIKDGSLKAIIGEQHGQRDIITKEQFENFELSFEFMISKATNSGVKYLVNKKYTGGGGKYLGLEYQILDDKNFVYDERGVYRSLASLYDLIPAQNKKTVALHKWHSARIIVNKNHVEHWLNGVKSVDYDRSDPHFFELVAGSKYKNLNNFGTAQKGHILLQNEGSAVAFRIIKIRTF